MTVDTKDMPLWRREFPAYMDVPEALTNDTDLYDLSYGNDVCPSFSTKAFADYHAEHPEDGDVQNFDLRLWVDAPDPELRECGHDHVDAAMRFCVYDGADTLFESETDLDGAVAMLKRVSAEILAKTYKPTNYRIAPKLTGRIMAHAICPFCGFNFRVPQDGYDRNGADVIRYDNNHDGGRGGYRVSCDSCGKPFVIEKDAVNALQHTCLVLLGEN